MIDRRIFLGCAVGAGVSTFSAICSGASPLSRPSSPKVRTNEGSARGYWDGDIAVFKGLRYRAPVRGEARFRRAGPPQRWDGVRDFTEYGESAPQTRNRSANIGLQSPVDSPMASFSEPQRQGEDCLRLNIWTPSLDALDAVPVMVWLHGGGFRQGSGSVNATDGRALAAAHRTVIITLNHRLGVFGHLSLDHLDATYADSGNVGMLDLVDALSWIRENVRAFGGDPNRVTIFGESGGGAKVCALLAMPAATGLFSGAICQSGALVWGIDRPMAKEAAAALLDRLKIRPENLKALASLPAEVLQEAADALGEKWARKFSPVIGGSLPEHPFANGAPAVSQDVPLIIGTSRDESTVLVGAPAMFSLDWTGLHKVLSRALSVEVDSLIGGWRRLYPTYSPSQILFAVMSQYLIIRSCVHVAHVRAMQGARTWAYSLEWPTPVFEGRFGAPHALSVPLVFGTMERVPSMVPVNSASSAVSALMGELWTSFAAAGAPVSSRVSWPAYSLTRQETLAINIAPSVVRDPRGDERRLMSAIPWFDNSGEQRPAPASAASGVV